MRKEIILFLGRKWTKGKLRTRTQADVRGCWRDSMILLEQLAQKPTTTEVAACLLPPSPSMMLFGQE